MKCFIHLRKYFVGGFIAAFMLFALTQCPEENATKSDEDILPTETTELKTFSESLITAFENQDIDKISEMMYEEHREFYIDDLGDYAEKMPIFAEALKSRKLTAMNELYAEYEITIEEQTYTIAYGQSGDANWKLLRF